MNSAFLALRQRIEYIPVLLARKADSLTQRNMDSG